MKHSILVSKLLDQLSNLLFQIFKYQHLNYMHYILGIRCELDVILRTAVLGDFAIKFLC